MTKRLWSQISTSRSFANCIAFSTASLSSAHSATLGMPKTKRDGEATINLIANAGHINLRHGPYISACDSLRISSG